ncbi:Protein FAR1-RELATED SEQUENCE 9, partial [Camellia lanceoleosa]
MEALREAAKKVASAKKNGPGVIQSSLAKEIDQEVNISENQIGQLQSSSVDKKIQELTAELENASQRCEAYRAKLLDVLKIMEEQKLKISVKVQNARLSLRKMEGPGIDRIKLQCASPLLSAVNEPPRYSHLVDGWLASRALQLSSLFGCV